MSKLRLPRREPRTRWFLSAADRAALDRQRAHAILVRCASMTHLVAQAFRQRRRALGHLKPRYML